jgi:hypothetical protein
MNQTTKDEILINLDTFIQDLEEIYLERLKRIRKQIKKEKPTN